MCEHLYQLEKDLHKSGIRETARGQLWSENCREWIYFDCVLNTDILSARYQFPGFVTIHTNDDIRSGVEEGFYCQLCKDAIMGIPRPFGEGKAVFG